MRDLFEIDCAAGAHPVRLSTGTLEASVASCAPSLIIADEFFRGALADAKAPVIFLEAEETSKEMAQMPALIEMCRRQGLTRDGMLVAVGGGVIQDIACFVASVYMRGLRWTYLPTTLLAMVDSCIGGKSSINVGDFKNLVGTFHPPAAVVISPGVLATLPPEHIAAGRAEAAKICFAHGDEAFARYLKLDEGRYPVDPAGLIEASLRSKKWFVEIDEFDRNERLLLNFGHSFGHALESCTAYGIPHGVAVGVGCLAALELSSLDWGDHRPTKVDAMERQLIMILEPVEGLADQLATIEREEFFRYFDSDKKHTRSMYRPVTVQPNGALVREQIPRGTDAADRIWSAFTRARDRLADLRQP